MRSFYQESQACVQEGEWFQVKVDTKGFMMLPWLFNLFTDGGGEGDKCKVLERYMILQSVGDEGVLGSVSCCLMTWH